MRLNLKFIPAILVALPALAAASPTSITFDKVDLGNDYQLNYNGHSEDVFVGSLLFSPATGAKNKTTFVSFCVDLDHFITNGQTYQVDPINTSTLSSASRYKLAGDILDAGIGSATDKDHSAALQMAIWSAVYGNKFSLSGVSSSVSNMEKSYFSNGAKFSGNAIYLKETKNCGQSQITTTPEPASMAVLGIGAVGFLFRRRRS